MVMVMVCFSKKKFPSTQLAAADETVVLFEQMYNVYLTHYKRKGNTHAVADAPTTSCFNCFIKKQRTHFTAILISLPQRSKKCVRQKKG